MTDSIPSTSSLPNADFDRIASALERANPHLVTIQTRDIVQEMEFQLRRLSHSIVENSTANIEARRKKIGDIRNAILNESSSMQEMKERGYFYLAVTALIGAISYVKSRCWTTDCGNRWYSCPEECNLGGEFAVISFFVFCIGLKIISYHSYKEKWLKIYQQALMNLQEYPDLTVRKAVEDEIKKDPSIDRAKKQSESTDQALRHIPDVPYNDNHSNALQSIQSHIQQSSFEFPPL